MLRFVLGIFVGLAAIILFAWLVLARPFVVTSLSAGPLLAANPANLKSHTIKLSKEFAPRDWKHIDNLNKTADYIEGEFRRTNHKVSLQSYSVQGSQFRNVISEYGAASERGTVVIGAHYDASGPFPGADDNASGVAGLLELARLVSTETFPFNLLLVAYTLEEPPFFGTEYMGSAVHAASLKAEHVDVRLMISLEMIGYFSDDPGSQRYPVPLLNLLYPSQGNFLAIVGPFTTSSATVQVKRAFAKSVSLPVLSINAPAALQGIDFSDHRNYWANGFDAVMLTDTAFLRNKAYHTEDDVAERLNFEKMAEVITGVHSYLNELKAGT